MNEWYESVDVNKLYFQYKGTEGVSFYGYYDSKELFNKTNNNQLRFDKALKNQKELLKKINEVKIGRKAPEQEEVINLEKFYNSREEVINFLKIMLK